MKTRKVDKREQHVRKKLTAAILMLLVSCIMTITSTYAWFTLSTAPEVTGIQTTIGGNGNLEIALATGETWVNTDQVQTLASKNDDITITNASWGNLIDVSPTLTDDPYGINKLVLAPAQLDATYTTEGNILEGTVSPASLLKAPQFGADGRVSNLLTGMHATFDGTSFTMSETTDYGIRAIGISTAMTARQTSFMGARSTASQSANLAKNATSSALNKNGGILGNLAVVLATADNRDNVSFTNSEYEAIYELITETENAAKNIDVAIINMIDAILASNTGKTSLSIDDTTYALMSSTIKNMRLYNEDTHQPSNSFTVAGNEITFSYAETEGGTPTITKTFSNEALATVISTYLDIRNDITSALNALPAKVEGEETRYYWGDKDGTGKSIGGAVSKLMDMSGNITVGGNNMDQLKQMIQEKDMQKLLALANNLNVNLGAGSGIYYDISSLVGTVQASILIDITYNGITMEDTPASLTSTNSTPIITTALAILSAPSSDGSAEASRISDIYGYAIDLLFRTNAADSSLLLQTTPTDRIYSDNANEETMGAGSTMTFTKTVASFSDAQMLKLMDSIRVVFIDENGTILGLAGLDTGTTNVTLYFEDEQMTIPSATETAYSKVEPVPNYKVNEADGSITVDVRLIHEFDATGKAKFITDDMEVTKTIVTRTYYTDESKTTVSDVETEWYKDETTTETETITPTICGLTQNVAKKLSVVVYLDGNTVTNGDVANASTSMTGTMNLQFASNADLTPMEYSGLHITTPGE